MKNYKKRFISVILISIILVLTLSACTSNENEEKITKSPQTPQEAITLLQEQNAQYVTATSNNSDISNVLREETVENGQNPYAVVFSCSDSRVVPEHIFMSGIGELFTIRNAGNVVDDIVIGSAEYGVEHLGAKVIVVLGHTHCGAVEATINLGGHDYIISITNEIEDAIEDETDARKAEILNVHNSISQMMESSIISELAREEKIKVVGAIYNTSTGEVEFLNEEEPTTHTDDNNKLYENAVEDAMIAEDSELKQLVTITKEDEMTTWNEDGEVLLLTWNKYPDSYKEGEEVVLAYGDIWTFTDKEITSWYSENKEDMDEYQIRLNQLIGLPPEDDNTHFTALWVNPEDIIRPAYSTDITKSNIEISTQDMESEYKIWFDNNIINSYYNESDYPWTRLGYTYDWADNNVEYGLTEFIVKGNSTVEVEFTMTTQDFIDYMNKNIA